MVKCANCGKDICEGEGLSICNECKIAPIKKERCFVCGQIKSENKQCRSCVAREKAKTEKIGKTKTKKAARKVARTTKNTANTSGKKFKKSDPCFRCGGSGKVGDRECSRCHGTGKQDKLKFFKPNKDDENSEQFREDFDLDQVITPKKTPDRRHMDSVRQERRNAK